MYAIGRLLLSFTLLFASSRQRQSGRLSTQSNARSAHEKIVLRFAGGWQHPVPAKAGLFEIPASTPSFKNDTRDSFQEQVVAHFLGGRAETLSESGTARVMPFKQPFGQRRSLRPPLRDF